LPGLILKMTESKGINEKPGWKIIKNKGLPEWMFNELVELWNEEKTPNPKEDNALINKGENI